MKFKILSILIVLIIIMLTIYLKFNTKPLLDQLDNKAIYKISSQENYNPENKADCIKLTELDIKSGFIHTSLGNQVSKILDKFFKNSKTVLLLELDKFELQKNGTVIKVEQNNPDGDFFPHLYGKQQIPASAIKSKIVVIQNKNGSWSIQN